MSAAAVCLCHFVIEISTISDNYVLNANKRFHTSLLCIKWIMNWDIYIWRVNLLGITPNHFAAIRDMMMKVLSFLKPMNEPWNQKKKPIFGCKKNRSALLVYHYNEYDLIWFYRVNLLFFMFWEWISIYRIKENLKIDENIYKYF